MKIIAGIFFVMVLCILIYSGHGVRDSLYDYTATTECLAEPQRAHYAGGLIVNPEFKVVVAHNGTKSLYRFTQKVHLEKGKLYSFSAWIQVGRGSETVSAVFKTDDENLILGGRVLAKHGCWSLLKGGLVANFTSPVEILLESNNKNVEIWADSVSLQPFTKEQWRSHQEKSINEVRKGKVRFQVTYANKTAVEGATISIRQINSGYPFGCGMNHYILTSRDYQNWFASRFKYTTFTNEMKWYSTEKKPGVENYTVADAMVTFCKQHGISIRGHNIFWDNPEHQPSWVKQLSPVELRKAAIRRINSVTRRYAGQLIAWDVVNENLHFRFFEDKLGEDASAKFYRTAYMLDPKTTMFLNEYNTIELATDKKANPINYKKKIDEIKSYPGNAGMSIGIGLQGHFDSYQPNIAYMRSALDILGSTGYPIWLTEVDVGIGPNQAQYLEEILREAYAHPAVHGIISFAGPAAAGFKVMPLADNDFKNTPAGDVVDKLLAEWKSKALVKTTDVAGSSEISLFHGDYNVTVIHPITNALNSLSFKVAKDLSRSTVNIQIDA